MAFFIVTIDIWLKSIYLSCKGSKKYIVFERRTYYGSCKSNIERSSYNGRIYIINSSMAALKDAQKDFVDEAERVGIKNDEDIINMIKELREESVVK